MQYSYLRVKDIIESNDRDSGEIRISAICEEVNSPEVRLNLSKQNASVISRFHGLKGRAAMIPVRHGVFNERPFMSLERGDIIDMPDPNAPVMASSTESSNDSAIPVEKPKTKLFNS